MNLIFLLLSTLLPLSNANADQIQTILPYAEQLGIINWSADTDEMLKFKKCDLIKGIIEAKRPIQAAQEKTEMLAFSCQKDRSKIYSFNFINSKIKDITIFLPLNKESINQLLVPDTAFKSSKPIRLDSTPNYFYTQKAVDISNSKILLVEIQQEKLMQSFPPDQNEKYKFLNENTIKSIREVGLKKSVGRTYLWRNENKITGVIIIAEDRIIIRANSPKYN